MIPTFYIPFWVVLAAHLAIGLGTLSGGWRIIKTMGQKITRLEPSGGFAAETGAAAAIFIATMLGVGISTTHTHHRGDRRGGVHAEAVGRAIGRRPAHPLGVGPDDSGGGQRRRRQLPGPEAVRRPLTPMEGRPFRAADTTRAIPMEGRPFRAADTARRP
jgi:hypothetical protein